MFSTSSLSRCAALVGLAWTIASSPAEAADTMCLNQLLGVPQPDGNGGFVFSGPPTIDGNVEADLGWRGAFEYQYINGTPVSDGQFVSGSNGNNVYFGWTVHNATTFRNGDTIVLAIGDASSNFIRFEINPVCDDVGVTKLCAADGSPTCAAVGASACASNVRPWHIGFVTGTLAAGSINWGPDGSVPNALADALQIAVNSASGGTVSWQVELRIPKQVEGLYDLSAGNFKVYSDAFRIELSNPPTFTVEELYWPPLPGNAIQGTIVNTPALANWGPTTTSGTCPGVKGTRIYSNGTSNNGANPAPNVINYDRTDMKLSVDLKNSGSVDATHVKANFRIAQFGFNSATSTSWISVPAVGNPTPNAQAFSVAKNNGVETYTTGNWDVTNDPDKAKYQAHPHQCILVELSSLDSVTFSNRSLYTNMDIGKASVFEAAPVEVPGNLGPLPNGRSENQYDVLVSPSSELTETGARLAVLSHGMRRTGQYVSLKTGRMVAPDGGAPTHMVPEMIRYEIVETIGSFGYLIDHEMKAAERETYAKATPAKQIAAWKFDLGFGQPIEPDAKRYSLKLAPGAVHTLKPRIEFVGLEGSGPGGTHGTSGDSGSGSGGGSNNGGGCNGCSGCAGKSASNTWKTVFPALAFAGVLAYRRRRRD